MADKQKANPFPQYAQLNLKKLADDVKFRRLPKRCFEISQSNVVCVEDDIDSTFITNRCERIISQCKNGNGYGSEELQKDIEVLSSVMTRSAKPILDELIAELSGLTYVELLDKRKEFFNLLMQAYEERKMKIDFNMFDIYIVFPKLVNYGATTEAVVLGKDHNELMTINDFVKLDDWASSFNSNKWRGYVFVTDKIDKSIALEISQKFILKGKAKLKNPSAYIKGIDE